MLKFVDLKGKNGITILTLTVTIIVLLILAGISVATLSGDKRINKKCTEKLKSKQR